MDSVIDEDTKLFLVGNFDVDEYMKIFCGVRHENPPSSCIAMLSKNDPICDCEKDYLGWEAINRWEYERGGHTTLFSAEPRAKTELRDWIDMQLVQFKGSETHLRSSYLKISEPLEKQC